VNCERKEGNSLMVLIILPNITSFGTNIACHYSWKELKALLIIDVLKESSQWLSEAGI
jgi:hypothetical protein